MLPVARRRLHIPPGHAAGLRYLLAATLLLAMGEAAGQSCTFSSGPTVALSFGTIDPSLLGPRNAMANIEMRCVPGNLVANWTFSGQHPGEGSPLRMKHSADNVFIPYSVSAQDLTGSGANRTWRITATVLGQDYEDAPVGAYWDVLRATISP